MIDCFDDVINGYSFSDIDRVRFKNQSGLILAEFAALDVAGVVCKLVMTGSKSGNNLYPNPPPTVSAITSNSILSKCFIVISPFLKSRFVAELISSAFSFQSL